MGRNLRKMGVILFVLFPSCCRKLLGFWLVIFLRFTKQQLFVSQK